MKRLYSSDEVIKALLRMGFKYAPKRGKGSHTALYRETPSGKRLVIVPHRKELARGTLHAILRQAGITLEELEKYI